MTTRFTPGPWQFEAVRGDHFTTHYSIGFPDGSGVAVSFTEPDGLLAAASPELYEALILALPYVQKVAATQPTEMNRQQRQFQAAKEVRRIRAVLAKACGEAGPAESHCMQYVPGTQSLCTRPVGHEGEHWCSAADVDRRKGG